MFGWGDMKQRCVHECSCKRTLKFTLFLMAFFSFLLESREKLEIAFVIHFARNMDTCICNIIN